MLFKFSEITMPPVPNKCEGADFERLKGDLSAKMFAQRLAVFEAQGGASGPWKPLSQIQQEKRNQKLDRVSDARQAELAAKGFHGVKILQDTGLLRQSFTPESGAGNEFKHVEIGEDFIRNSTNVKYAAIQNFGGVIVPVKAKALCFADAGGALIFAKRVTIPARPFDEFSDQDEEELAEVTEHYLNENNL